MNPPTYICVDGASIPRKYVHEAGHAVTGAALSTGPVSLCDRPALTDEGNQADAICSIDWPRGKHEPIEPWFESRIAAIYAGVLAEASFEVPNEAMDKYALCLWEYVDQTDGPKVEQMSVCEMPEHGINDEEGLEIRKKAWNRARQTITENKEHVARVAIAFYESGCLKNVEIRALTTSRIENK
jgi:hypothetical protein